MPQDITRLGSRLTVDLSRPILSAVRRMPGCCSQCSFSIRILSSDDRCGILSAHECNTFLSWKLRTLPTLDKVLHFYLELGGGPAF